MKSARIGQAEKKELELGTNSCAIIHARHHLQRDSCDPRSPDGRQLPVECLETVLVGEFVPLLKTYSPSTY